MFQNTAVTAISGTRGAFELKTAAGDLVHAEHVVLCIGLQGNIRKLAVPGEDLAITRDANLHAAVKDSDEKTWAKRFDVEATRRDIRLVLAVILVVAGMGFKIAAVPFQIWAPDVYQGAPTPTTAFLAIGSKAAGFVLLLRVLFTAVPSVTMHWEKLLIVISGVTILYGNLCALPQRNIKRLLGYSSISHAGYLLLGVAALNAAGQSAILYYLAGYLFTTLAAFLVIALVLRQLDNDDISGLAGLGQRSPLLAATMTISMASLAGIPPLAGFFGKFLLLKSVVEAAKTAHLHTTGYYCLVFVALAGVVISLYYYFNVVRAMYWSREIKETSPIELSAPAKVAAWICIVGMFWLGLFPGTVLKLAESASLLAGK